MPNTIKVVTGVVLDENTRLTLVELCCLGKTNAEYILELVEEGLLEPEGSSTPDWRFDSRALIRLQKTIHLQHDLRVNLAGAALVLDLLEEVEELRRKQ
jgi:chaperone modulatory protein CbpM